ncbi:hypothetical protein [Paraburkholderia terrae]|uniref:hypothetical protein n=1 Tax=Paraburkholderia terrae TaxID=311230 RepID=UPI0033654B14
MSAAFCTADWIDMGVTPPRRPGPLLAWLSVHADMHQHQRHDRFQSADSVGYPVQLFDHNVVALQGSTLQAIDAVGIDSFYVRHFARPPQSALLQRLP